MRQPKLCASFPGGLDRQQAIKSWVRLYRRIQHGRELPELGVIEAEEHLVKEHRLSFVAGGFQHEVRAAFPKQVRSLVDQVALLRQGSKINGGVTHGISK